MGLYLIHGKILSSTSHLHSSMSPRFVACSTTSKPRAALGAWRGETCPGPRKPRSKPPWTLALGTRFQRDFALKNDGDACRSSPSSSIAHAFFPISRILPWMRSFLRTLSYLVPQACGAHGGDCCFEVRLMDNCRDRMGLRNWWLRLRSWPLDDESSWFRDV